MSEKVSVAACSGMSPMGLVARVSCDDLSKSDNHISSICMSSVSANRDGYINYIDKYPIIAVNGCKNNCVNSILKQKKISVSRTVIVKKVLDEANLKANDTSRLDIEGEKCVDKVKDVINEVVIKMSKK
ncbi:MAG: putative zinc-binding protein [Methanosphaera sp.]|jgi:uncharacterized metal-binding protein|uniref:putative zinc-binding protein n=1 Tax=Methanosphaera TaxID=2316 RepID=UPI000DC51265|nr:putative zinc-binding protein [Candidatus Methanosphaera massiliense]MDD6285497.1 putative zinc-binding protein [Methanobacteriaceae archaeon]MDE4078622.1 putative zinc-binding protein [Candidatus Methanosphaera massiliense]RAP44796.1 MAG: zinc-binding protein [Methanosphaera sp. SHI1033]